MRSETLRKERKARRNVIIMGLIMVFLMVFSMLAVYVNNSGEDTSGLSYNGYTFKVEDVEGGQMASIELNGRKYYFYYLPSVAQTMAENLTGVDEMVSAQKVIFTKEPLGLNNQASSAYLYFDKLILDLQTASGKQIISGLSAEDEFSDKLVYSCEDASAESPVVMLKNGIYTSINITEVSDNCFEIKSDTSSVLVLRDYILYKSLGIIA